MCCFSRPVEVVADTSIFARSANDRQFLVYSMTYAAAADLAMVLPLPVPAHPAEDAVTFINLERYPDFFADMARGFPSRVAVTLSAGAPPLQPAKLRVHEVGSFEASFVPRSADFDRLDERFRMPAGVWDQLPAYRDYGFAVFKLRGAASQRHVHPMALSFPHRDPHLLYFPTVHVHDREVHPQASFDHVLYCQPDRGMDEYVQGWEPSFGPASKFLDTARAERIVDSNSHCWRHPLEGLLQNKDAYVGRGGSLPVHPRPEDALPPSWIQKIKAARQFLHETRASSFSLSYRTPSGAEGTFEISRSEVSIGRSPNCDISVRDSGMSSHHAKLVQLGGRVWLYDLKSKAGTRLNGAPILEAVLADGDAFTCGEVEFRLESKVKMPP